MQSTDSEFRGYSCYYSILHDGRLLRSNIAQCWRGLDEASFPIASMRYGFGYQDVLKYKSIYISDYEMSQTTQYIPLLLSTINQITPCEEIVINKIKYIKFDLLETYTQSLILLNFIRYLWHSPMKGNYSIEFFEKLKETNQEDAFERLTWAGKESAKNRDISIYQPPGHSNLFFYKTLLVRKTKELKDFKETDIRRFLTNQDS